MSGINTTVFLSAPAGYITVEAKKPGETNYSATTIMISDILRIKDIPNNYGISTLLSRSQNDSNKSHELTVKATRSHIIANMEAHKQPADILPEE
jgi:hypothetical protein